jgi:beta-phosphoglucomutase
VISAIVFDFDGVLVDSEPLHLRAYQEVLEPFGLSLPREKYYSSYLGYDDTGVFRAVAEARNWPLDDRQLHALIEEKCRVVDGLLSGGDIMYNGAADCVARLAAVWPLGIASGAARPEIETMLRGRGLERYFRFIVASGETSASKPAPDPYRKAATLHGHPPEACVAIEDSRWGIESAKAAGLWCIGITHTYPVSELLEADAIVTSLAELTPELIKNLA